jgi:intracellular sulfur oxidation DsrE/DsrF family protein
MRKILLLFFLTTCFTTLCAQKDKTQEGPFFKDFGTTYKVKDVDLLLDKDTNYKVIFDVFTHPGKKNSVNPLLNTVARFMNMHGHTGLDKEQMQIVVVVHGEAIPNMLREEEHQKALGKSNPNAKLVKALEKAGVETYVCGQSLTYKGYEKKQLIKGVKMSLSAMTALVHFQKEGYQLINFN